MVRADRRPAGPHKPGWPGSAPGPAFFFAAWLLLASCAGQAAAVKVVTYERSDSGHCDCAWLGAEHAACAGCEPEACVACLEAGATR